MLTKKLTPGIEAMACKCQKDALFADGFACSTLTTVCGAMEAGNLITKLFLIYMLCVLYNVKTIYDDLCKRIYTCVEGSKTLYVFYLYDIKMKHNPIQQ